jgi:hypothetical protein
MGLIFDATSKAWTINHKAIYTKPITNPPVYENLLAIPHIDNTLKLTNLSTLAAEGQTGIL